MSTCSRLLSPAIIILTYFIQPSFLQWFCSEHLFYSVQSGNCPFFLQLLFIWAVQNWEAFGKVLSNHNVVVSIFLERRIWSWSSWSQLTELLLWRWYMARQAAAQAAVNGSSVCLQPSQRMRLLAAHASCLLRCVLARSLRLRSASFPAPAGVCLRVLFWGRTTDFTDENRSPGSVLTVAFTEL